MAHTGVQYALERERGQWAVYCTSPQSLAQLYNFWDFQLILIGWFKLSVQTFLTTKEGVILCVIIGDVIVHQFVGHCLIPSDPWYSMHLN